MLKISKRKLAKPEEIGENLEERVIEIRRTAKVTKGGKNLRFRALVVVGDRNGHVGVGLGKAREVVEAIRKGVAKAKKSMIKVPLTPSATIPHEVYAKFKAAYVMIKPAGPGTGVIAGGAMRPILELAGIRNVLAKIIRPSTNSVAVAQATMKALLMLRSPEEIAEERGKKVWEVLPPKTKKVKAKEGKDNGQKADDNAS